MGDPATLFSESRQSDALYKDSKGNQEANSLAGNIVLASSMAGIIRLSR